MPILPKIVPPSSWDTASDARDTTFLWFAARSNNREVGPNQKNLHKSHSRTIQIPSKNPQNKYLPLNLP
jgi:hypothetical protein